MVSAFLAGPVAAELEPVAVNTDLDLNGAEGIVVSADGRHVYVASAAADTVTAWSRNPTTGLLTKIQTLTDDSREGTVEKLDGPNQLVLSPDDRHLYVTVQVNEPAVVSFARDTTTGMLTEIDTDADGDAGGSDYLDNLQYIAISPDGEQVFVTSTAPASALVAFQRDSASGQLAFDFEIPWAFNQNFLLAPRGVAVSPDGAQVYVASDADRAITTYARSGAGELTITDADGPGNIGELLLGVTEVAVSADGTSVYTASQNQNSRSIGAFARTGAGVISLAEGEPIAGIGLGPNAVAVSPNGKRLYTDDNDTGEVLAYARNAGTGTLEFVARNDAASIGGGPLTNPRDVAVSPDGRHLYATSSNQKIFVFDAPEPGAVSLGVATLGTLAIVARRGRSARGATPPRATEAVERVEEHLRGRRRHGSSSQA